MNMNTDKKAISSKRKQSETLYLSTLQVGEKVELYKVFRKGRVQVTKRSKIGVHGFVCPKFLREISILSQLMNPPKHLENHPGRNNIIKMTDVYVEDGYLHFDMEVAHGTLCGLKNTLNVNPFKEQILIDISNGLQYMHEMGFNHWDLSLNNIMYFDNFNTGSGSIPESILGLEPDDESMDSGNGTKLFRFVLVDFGNSVHKNRFLALEISTYYTMSLEMIQGLKVLQDLLDHMKQDQKSAKMAQGIDAQGIDTMIKGLRDTVIHKKSDIWSLGALSYYLHSYNFYADGDTLDEQQDKIKNKKLRKTDRLVGHSEFVSKTNIMLLSDHKIRPVTYFSKIHKPITAFNSKAESSEHKYEHLMRSLYGTTIDNIIKTISVKNLINVMDHRMKQDMINHCYGIEKNVVHNILIKIRQAPDLKIIKMMNALHLTRLVILWLTTHLYVNDVWTMEHLITYFNTTCTTHRTHKNTGKSKGSVCQMIQRIAHWVLEEVNWDLDKYQGK